MGDTASNLTRWHGGIGVAVVLAAFATAALPAVPVATAQLVLLVGVLAGAAGFGLVAGLCIAGAGFALLLWRDLAMTGLFGVGQIIECVIWFAVAKLVAALIARQRAQLLKQGIARQAAETAARQVSLLAAEQSHRVRNDMHRLIGLLNTEARNAPQAAGVLLQVVSRILVLTRLHERLAVRDSKAVVESRGFLEELGNDLRNTIETSRSIGLIIAAENHPIAPGVAADLGLIVNELVTNALKHAFPASIAGAIRVTFRRSANTFELVVGDNGVGLRPARSGSGLGLQLVQGLASQLQGRIAVAGGEVGGTQCRLLFPADATVGPDDTAVSSLAFPAIPPRETDNSSVA